MRKKLTRIGKDFAIVIERPILELLDISANAELEVRTDGTRLIIEPVAQARLHTRADIERLSLELMSEFDATFRELAAVAPRSPQ